MRIRCNPLDRRLDFARRLIGRTRGFIDDGVRAVVALLMVPSPIAELP
jgi:hypothetical protein